MYNSDTKLDISMLSTERMKLENENADFATLIGWWQRHMKDRKMIYQVNKLFHPSTTPEILVNIGPLDSEKPVLDIDH